MSLRIIFMGTPEFAVPSLAALHERSSHEVVGVITATDKWGGRGKKKLLQSAVKRYAVANDLPVLQPEKFRNKDFLKELAALRADLQVVVAFRMLPEVVWDMPPLGTFNLHGSLLPKYRGAAPIHWAVIRGEQETGVTTFMIQHQIDTGNIILQRSIPIDNTATTGDIYERLMKMGAEVVLETVDAIEKGDVKLMPQDHSQATSAPKLNRDNTRIDPKKGTTDVYNFIRGLNPYPAAWLELDGLDLLVYSGKIEEDINFSAYQPGDFVSDGKKHLWLIVADGAIDLIDIKLSGKRRMAIRDFLNGYKLEDSQIKHFDR